LIPCRRWVVDKNAGETILHRASKQGYPDVVAYALDLLSMGAMEKDYAGLTPLHKAAFRGHHNNVRLLLKYGADPSAQVKGTRAMHEGEINGDAIQFSHCRLPSCMFDFFSIAAIECPSPESVRALLSYGGDIFLHNYNGQTPLDLAEATTRDGDTGMRNYICNLIADLHGRVPGLRSKEVVPVKRWNVSHAPDYHDPLHPESGLMEVAFRPPAAPSKQEEFVFEMSKQPLPTTFQLTDRLGFWVLLKDLKDFAKKTGQSRLASDLKNKGELVEMNKAEFVKASHCSQLDRRAVEVRGGELVTLAKVDSVVRRIFNSELVAVPY
jgi:ankyrin repeat protein